MALNVVIHPEAVPKLKSVHFTEKGELLVEYHPEKKTKVIKTTDAKKTTRKRTTKKKSTKKK